MYEGQETSSNKTHLFNWLYDTTVQMAQGVSVCLFNVRAMSFSLHYVHFCMYLDLSTCVHVGVWLTLVPAIRILTSFPFRKRDEEPH